MFLSPSFLLDCWLELRKRWIEPRERQSYDALRAMDRAIENCAAAASRDEDEPSLSCVRAHIAALDADVARLFKIARVQPSVRARGVLSLALAYAALPSPDALPEKERCLSYRLERYLALRTRLTDLAQTLRRRTNQACSC